MSTLVLNLFGGPGIGKSTSAAYIFYKLKSLGVNAELVREYVKDWAWDQRHINIWDQLYFLGKQIRRESMLYSKVDVIVTDAPVALLRRKVLARTHSERRHCCCVWIL